MPVVRFVYVDGCDFVRGGSTVLIEGREVSHSGALAGVVVNLLLQLLDPFIVTLVLQTLIAIDVSS